MTSILMIGATGAVGSHTLAQLVQIPEITRITLLVRRKADILSDKVTQHIVDLLDPSTYQEFVSGHYIAISTFGVGEPTKISKEEFIKIDKDAVLSFAKLCKNNGIRHFQSLGSIGVSSKSSQYYLKTKGELEDALEALAFDRLSLFHPSMILTPTNRYGFSQALTLAIWPILTPVLLGPLRKMRGVKVDCLGKAIANNVNTVKNGVETIEWDGFQALAGD